ncbi:septum-promoting GTP-binding protein 1-like isoform X2 [Wolffia australiana]
MVELQRTLARVRSVRVLRCLFCFFWKRVLVCLTGKSPQYLALNDSTDSLRGISDEAVVSVRESDVFDGDSDLVSLKVSLLGDCDIGKTTFMTKYIGAEEQTGAHIAGLNLMDKILPVKGARIAFRIWDIKGDRQSRVNMPLVCKDAAAILIMFDLTNRLTLNSAVGWYNQARRWNKAIPVLVGTKFDGFIRLPLEMQWAVAKEARAWARVMNAALFFSSASHNINVNKIFKYVAARHFDLPWSLERNLTLGEPIIDY